MASRSLMGVIVFLVISAAATAEPNDWAHYGHTAARHSIAVDGPNTIDSGTLAWNAWEDPCYPGYYVEFEGATGPVVYDGKVYGYAKFYEPNEFGPGGFDYVASQVISFDANSGAALWATVIDQAIWDSWSSPCVDAKHDTVLIGSGTKLYALDADAGGVIWSTQLEKMTINASVCVALDIPFARAFITDYDGFGDTGKLYCVNLDPNVASNLYEPGEIVWSDGIGGSSGNSPAYADGVVYVGSVSEPPGSVVSGGTIHAYDATSSTVSKLWEATDPNFEGFFGGLVVTKAGYIYAANYDFFDNEDNSALCKIDCSDGSVVWFTAVERTQSIPIVVGDRIYISAGMDGFGSRPKVEAYQDLGSSATKLWETPAGMVVGGWTNQPVYANGKLYVGSIPVGGNYFGTYTDLYIFDTSKLPADPNFVIDHYSGCGNSCAVTYDSVYTIGYDGLFKFHQPALLADITGDGGVDGEDLYEFVKDWLYDGALGIKRADMDVDGDVDFLDYAKLAGQWNEQLN